MTGFMGIIFERIMQYIRPDEVLNGEISYNRIPLDRLQRICFATEDDMSEIALEKKLEYLRSWVLKELLEEGKRVDILQCNESSSAIGLFDLLNCLSDKILKVEHDEVIFRYEEMNAWHRFSGKLGSELPVACVYAYNDYRYAISRETFLWKNVLDHDNYALNSILDKKISDNHFHLHGSTPYFDLSWISLMNSLTQTRVIKHLDQMQRKSRSVETTYYGETRRERYNILHLKAALIRVYLYSCLTGKRIWLDDYEASADWLLEQIFRMEDVEQYVQCSLKIEDPRVSLREYIEQSMFYSQDVGRSAFLEMRHMCPGFYWFFWELFPEIPLGKLPVTKVLFCDENFKAIVIYVKKHYKKVSLHRCAWLFQENRIWEYEAEWDRQTKNAMRRLLKDPYILISSRDRIQSAINGFQNYDSKDRDYMLNELEQRDKKDWYRAVFSGEHWFIYHMIYDHYYNRMSRIFEKDNIFNLFFAYLLIKETFRLELLQCNDKIGFENFQAYQRRKNWFTTSYTKGELAGIAVNDAFQASNLKSLELRIMPEKCSADNVHIIERYDHEILKDYKGKKVKYYYVFHFRKQRDTSIIKDCNPAYRHEKYRRELKRHTNAILQMREHNYEKGRRLLGVDACSGEDGCRPEVFANAFRVLKNHQVENPKKREKMPQLRISYHVGEENQDVLDGLRAIDEAILFLNMESADRLGHATMLGVDAMEWYYKRHYQVSIRQQDYLDNVVWLYEKIVEFHIPNENNLLEYLEGEFQLYFERIYHSRDLGKAYENIDNYDFHIHHYFTAWELRGDDPALYRSGSYARLSCPHTIWDDNAINKQVEREKRDIRKAAALYHAYHYNARVREEGNKSIVVNIPIHMVKGILAVQRKMRKKIAQKGIAIETNPTSNVLIGRLEGYEKHPIVAFYNKGLTNNVEQLNECPQLDVSINTDDLGVFTTSLKNEYSLMAHALEIARDQEGNRLYKKDMVYDWINYVRKMGNKQSFRKKEG